MKQSATAIDAGVFHNDVVAASHENLLLFHESAYENADISGWLQKCAPENEWKVMCVTEKELPLKQAVFSYVFNSQIVTKADGFMAYIAPFECAENPAALRLMEQWRDDPSCPVDELHFMDLKQSMRNGGGPACLRLRVPLEKAEWDAAHDGVKFSAALDDALCAWVEKHYRDRLSPQDLHDPQLAQESLTALAALETILGLEGLYEFSI